MSHTEIVIKPLPLAAIVVGSLLFAGVGFVAVADETAAPIPGVPLLGNSVPAATTSVRDTALAYLEAAKSHECGTTKALTLSTTWAWCNDPRLISFANVQKPESFTEGGPKEICVAFTMNTTGSSDDTISRGPNPWSFCFTKTSHGWRLYDQGQG